MIKTTSGTRAGRCPALVNQPPMGAGVTPPESGENGLSKALDRERARYHERQSTLLARVLGGKRKQPKRSGVDDRAGTGHGMGRTTVGAPSGPLARGCVPLLDLVVMTAWPTTMDGA